MELISIFPSCDLYGDQLWLSEIGSRCIIGAVEQESENGKGAEREGITVLVRLGNRCGENK